jgi:hypothetical protein
MGLSVQTLLAGRSNDQNKTKFWLEFDIRPGNHQLHLKIDWCRSNIVNFETTGSLVEFECGSNLRGIKLLLGFFYITFLRSQYIWLKKI